MLKVVDLEDGEMVEAATVAEIGSMKGPATEMGATAVVGIAAAVATGFGGYSLARRARMGVVLTDRRLLFVDANQTTGKFLNVAAEWPRAAVARGSVKSKIYLSYELFDREKAEPFVKLSFPLPAKSIGQEIADALPEIALP